MAFEIKRFDTRPYYRIQLTANGTPVDLTGATGVDFTMAPAAVPTPKFTNAAGFIIDAATGVVEYRWATGDTNSSGTAWRMEVRVTWAPGATQTFPSKGYFAVDIYDDLDNG